MHPPAPPEHLDERVDGVAELPVRVEIHPRAVLAGNEVVQHRGGDSDVHFAALGDGSHQYAEGQCQLDGTAAQSRTLSESTRHAAKRLKVTTSASADPTTVCALCHQLRPLVDSHLIPSFVIRAWKEEAITRFLRMPANPTMRYQDGPTEKLLCNECDNVRLSDGETAFGMHVFAARRARTLTDFTCAEKDRYFAASLTWRIVIFKLRQGDENLRTDDYTDDDIATMREAEAALRPYLLGEAPYPDGYPQHILFSDLSAGYAPANLDVYLQAMMEMWIPGKGDTLYAASNLSFGILVFCPLRSSRQSPRDGTLLQPGAIIRTTGQRLADHELVDILAARGLYLEQFKIVSPAQKDKISKAIATADIPKWLRGWHGSAYSHEQEKSDADPRVFLLVVWDEAGRPHETPLPFEAVSAALASSMPDVVEAVDALEVTQGKKVVIPDIGEFALVRLE